MAQPYSSKQLAAIAKQLGDTYADGETRILRILAQGSISDWKRAFATEQLRQIRAILARLPVETQDWAQLHLPGLYEAGMRFAEGHIVGQIAPPLQALHQTAISIIGENLATNLGDALTRVGRTVDDAYRTAALEGIQRGLVGGETRAQVSRRIVADLQKQGLTAFTDARGREWTLPRYAEMVARTTTREATSSGIRNRSLEAGVDLVIISSHSGSCELCAPWENEVVSLTGATEGYPTIMDAYDAGYAHPNCGHTETPYYPEDAEVPD